MLIAQMSRTQLLNRIEKQTNIDYTSDLDTESLRALLTQWCAKRDLEWTALAQRNKVLSNKRSTEAQREEAVAQCSAVFQAHRGDRAPFTFEPEFIGPHHPDALVIYRARRVETIITQ